MTDVLTDALAYAVADLPATAADVRDWLAHNQRPGDPSQ